jgi:hypothetical protein
MNPKNSWMFLMFFRVGQSLTTLILLSLILTPCTLTVKLRNSTSSLWNLHFLGLSYKLAESSF